MDREEPVVNDAIALIRKDLKDFYPEREIHAFTEIILKHLTGYNRTDILLNLEEGISVKIVKELKEIITQLQSYRPIQHITGNAMFYGLKLKVSPDVLIPRQETEELVKWVIEDTGTNSAKILDIGTGTGCIAIALALNLPFANVIATDISVKAVTIARFNAGLHKAGVKFLVEDIFAPIIVKSEKYDIIVSNPPYVTDSEKQIVGKNVLYFEPAIALFVSDNQAMIYYESIATLAREVLNPGGRLFFEINESRSEEIVQILKRNMFSNIEPRRDINGKFRMVKALL